MLAAFVRLLLGVIFHPAEFTRIFPVQTPIRLRTSQKLQVPYVFPVPRKQIRFLWLAHVNLLMAGGEITVFSHQQGSHRMLCLDDDATQYLGQN
jgi:hypothetical protein